MQSRKVICNITIVYAVGSILAQFVINLGVNKLRYSLYGSMRPRSFVPELPGIILQTVMQRSKYKVERCLHCGKQIYLGSEILENRFVFVFYWLICIMYNKLCKQREIKYNWYFEQFENSLQGSNVLTRHNMANMITYISHPILFV